MFNSSVLDLTVGLIFVFLSISLATAAIAEVISSCLALRARTLRAGIGQLLNDGDFRGLAREVYTHAAVNPRGDGKRDDAQKSNRKDPAYIDRQLFGQAMLDILKISPEIAKADIDPNAPRGKPTETALKNAVDQSLKALSTAPGNTPDDQLQKLLYGIIERSLGDPDKIKEEVVAWFDNAMDRVSGWYKRWAQLVTFIVALLLAAALNIDAVEIGAALWVQPKLAADLVKNWPSSGATATAPSGAAVSGASNVNRQETPAAMLQRLDTTLPVGWPLKSDQALGIALLGWLITAASTVFGAPFWFDLLQTVIRLKGSGPSPLEKDKHKGAAA
jgi:hypothetical protein